MSILTPKQIESAIKERIKSEVLGILEYVGGALQSNWIPGKKLACCPKQVQDQNREAVHSAVVAELAFKGWKATWRMESDQREQESTWFLEVEATV